MYIFQQTFRAYLYHRQNFYFIYKAPGGASNDLFVETAATCLSPPLFSLLSFSAIEFCDFCCCSTPRSSTFSSAALLPPREGWEVCLASWLGNRFSCGQKYDYGVERSGTLLSPGLIGCSPLPTGPVLFVNGKRVMGILCRIRCLTRNDRSSERGRFYWPIVVRLVKDTGYFWGRETSGHQGCSSLFSSQFKI